MEKEFMRLSPGSVCVVNAAEMRDLEFVASAIHATWRRGKHYLLRTAASMVRALAGLSQRPLVKPSDVVLKNQHGGLIVVGSHVPRTTAQLDRLREQQDIVTILLSVDDVLRGEMSMSSTIERIKDHLTEDRNVVVYTSRKVVKGASDAEMLDISKAVSNTLARLVKALSVAPKFLIAKGGITSSDIASEGLGVTRATVMGQLLPGIPVWRLGDETRFPGLGYVIFPGNVGSESSLLECYLKLNKPATA